MNEELDLLELFYAFWKKKIWLILAIVIGACIGFAYTRYAVTPKYTSSVTLILAKSSDNNKTATTTVDDVETITQSDITLNQKLISTYGEILSSKRVANLVIKNLGLNMSYEQIKKGINVSSVKDTDVIKLSITTANAETSARIANEMTNVFKDEVDRIYNIKNISVIDSAEVNKNPVNIHYTKNIVIFALGLFALVAVVIFLIYYFDNTIKTEEAIQKLTSLPVLCTVPMVKKTGAEKGGKKNA